MRNAAMILGVIAGLIGMLVGFVGYGYVELIDRFGEIDGLAEQVDNAQLIQTASILAPLLAIAGEHDTSMELIILANSLRNPQALQGGQELLIPLNRVDVGTPTVIHEIKGGDTFSYLSFFYGSTVDDILDILQEETTEDIYALSGVQSEGDNYFQASLLTIARRRVVWLLVLLLTNSVTGSILKTQQDLIQQVVSLSFFIPLLTGTGGNVGAQSSTVVIRKGQDFFPSSIYIFSALSGKDELSTRQQFCPFFCTIN